MDCLYPNVSVSVSCVLILFPMVLGSIPARHGDPRNVAMSGPGYPKPPQKSRIVQKNKSYGLFVPKRVCFRFCCVLILFPMVLGSIPARHGGPRNVAMSGPGYPKPPQKSRIVQKNKSYGLFLPKRVCFRFCCVLILFTGGTSTTSGSQ